MLNIWSPGAPETILGTNLANIQGRLFLLNFLRACTFGDRSPGAPGGPIGFPGDPFGIRHSARGGGIAGGVPGMINYLWPPLLKAYIRGHCSVWALDPFWGGTYVWMSSSWADQVHAETYELTDEKIPSLRLAVI